jgi:hypothetical protein
MATKVTILEGHMSSHIVDKVSFSFWKRKYTGIETHLDEVVTLHLYQRVPLKCSDSTE